MRARHIAELIALAVLTIASILGAWWVSSANLTGLTGRYWNNTTWNGAPVAVARGAMPTASDFVQRRNAVPHSAGSAEWTGWFVVNAPGEYRFDVVSDDGAWLYVDERLVVNNGGEHGPVPATGRLPLVIGSHVLRVRYFQVGGSTALDVWWTRPGGTPDVLRATDVSPAKTTPSQRRLVPYVTPVAVAVPLTWACLFLYVPVRIGGRWAWRQVRRTTPEVSHQRVLALLLVAALILVAWRIDWGAGGDAWAPDELSPALVRWALDARLSGGWYDRYPVLHYAVLAIPVSAFELASHFSVLPIFALDAHTAQLIAMRGVSVLLGLGALVAVYLCGAEMLGATCGLGAALVLMLTPLFVYYGKTANLDVPALCWFAWAVLAVLRILRRNERGDFVVLAVAAAAAVATKDQMYASLGLLAIPPVVAVTRHRRSGGWSPLMLGAIVTVGAFAVFSNVLFNFSGFVSHVKVLSSFPSLALVPRTAGGLVELTVRSISLFRLALGWPSFLLAVAGVLVTCTRPERRWWLWLVLVPVSCHLTFTWVALYTNDRYQFGGVLVLALFAGTTIADLVNAERRRAGARVMVACSIVWSLLNAASVNAMMTRDARNVAREWITDRAGVGTAVATLGSYVPYFAPPIRAVTVDTPADIDALRPQFVVVNERFARTLPTGGPSHWLATYESLRNGSPGYMEAFRYRSPLPAWAVLQYEAVFRSGSASDSTNLDKINPETVVYERGVR